MRALSFAEIAAMGCGDCGGDVDSHGQCIDCGTWIEGLAPLCYIDDCGQAATLIVPSYPDDVRLCGDHEHLHEPEPWEKR